MTTYYISYVKNTVLNSKKTEIEAQCGPIANLYSFDILKLFGFDTKEYYSYAEEDNRRYWYLDQFKEVVLDFAIKNEWPLLLITKERFDQTWMLNKYPDSVKVAVIPQLGTYEVTERTKVTFECGNVKKVTEKVNTFRGFKNTYVKVYSKAQYLQRAEVMFNHYDYKVKTPTDKVLEDRVDYLQEQFDIPGLSPHAKVNDIFNQMSDLREADHFGTKAVVKPSAAKVASAGCAEDIAYVESVRPYYEAMLTKDVAKMQEFGFSDNFIKNIDEVVALFEYPEEELQVCPECGQKFRKRTYCPRCYTEVADKYINSMYMDTIGYGEDRSLISNAFDCIEDDYGDGDIQ